MLFVDTPIEYLKGVGPARAQLLQRELDIYTYGDLLEYFPYRYVDRSQVSTIRDINIDEPYVVLRGTIHDLHTIGNGKSMRLSAQLRDATGQIELVWFQGLKWIRESLKPDTEYIVMGKPSVFNDHINIAHPDLERADREGASNIKYIPIYSSTEKLKAKGLHTKGIAKLTEQLLRMAGGHIPETLPVSVIEKYKLPSRANAIEVIHYPVRPHDIALSIQRMKFEELFFLQLDYQYAKHERQMRSNGYVFPVVGEKFNRFYNERLTFELTGAQKRVVKEIRADMKSGHQMNRLLQGDVGSGKTLVALLTMLIAIDNGCQTCLMAPTEILANQHYANISKMLDGLGVSVELLTGALKPSAKKKIKQRLKEGEIDILIGTHAVIEKDVQFKNLGFVVIDEQHRFGVEQRSKLWTKSAQPPHVLVMTATPIPRTLAMTVYGDLDCSIIDELPPGRKAVKTIHATDHQRLKVFGFIREQIARGRQVYIVYPLIEESETMDLKDLMDGYESIAREFPLPQYQISIVHGRMDSEAKDYEMGRFKRGETQIMVSTTVIEVGVDVPNASVMIIENAERFGLSQLHQLRGRVGRGAEQSYCILMTGNKLSNTARERIKIMVDSTDGFRIAEADLRLRGPGDLQGLQQSGILQLKLADIVGDETIVRAARETVQEILEKDPRLESLDNACLRLYLQKNKRALAWGKIS
ncbi:MAG: ATP-dependent DNA helicase RecG [Bacteroidales bacterium]|nr:ATP-dependent DNA helicase RecG [Bacteroidales bacterium]MBR6330803.1 ATP-dependent DNA helicase RecG [Bacteroidales bacterium]